METVTVPTNEEPKKKQSLSRILLRILLVILAFLLLLIVSALIYLYTSGFAYDDAQAMASSKPMPFEERYSFMADDSTVTFSCDEADLWWLFQETGVKDAVKGADEALAPYHATLTNFGISLDNKAPEVYVEATVLGFIKVPLKAVLSIHMDAVGIYAKVEEAWLGQLIQLNLEDLLPRFGYRSEDLVFYVARDIHPRLKELCNVGFCDGRICVTTKIGAEVFEEAEADTANLRQFNCYACLPAYDVVCESQSIGKNATGDTFTRILQQAETNPESFLEFRMDALAMAEPSQAEKYLQGRYSSYLERFLPEISMDSISARRNVYLEEQARNNKKLQELMEAVYQAHLAHQLALDNGGFYYSPAEKTLTLPDLMGDEWMKQAEWLRDTPFRLVYANNMQAAFHVREHDAPYLFDIPVMNTKALQGLDSRRRYPLALIMKMPIGMPVLLYLKSPMQFTALEMEPKAYDELMASEQTPFVNASDGSLLTEVISMAAPASQGTSIQHEVGTEAYYSPQYYKWCQFLNIDKSIYPISMYTKARVPTEEDFASINPDFPKWVYEIPYNIGIGVSYLPPVYERTNVEVSNMYSEEQIASLLDEASAMVYFYYEKDYENEDVWLDHAQRMLCDNSGSRKVIQSGKKDIKKYKEKVEVRFATDRSLIYVDWYGSITVRGVVFTNRRHGTNFSENDIDRWAFEIVEVKMSTIEDYEAKNRVQMLTKRPYVANSMILLSDSDAQGMNYVSPSFELDALLDLCAN